MKLDWKWLVALAITLGGYAGGFGNPGWFRHSC